MAFVETVTQPSGNITSTLSGSIQIDDSLGLMRIYDSSTGVNLVTIDRTGFLFSDGVDRRIKLGSYAMSVGFWLSKPGEDVIDLLGG